MKNNLQVITHNGIEVIDSREVAHMRTLLTREICPRLISSSRLPIQTARAKLARATSSPKKAATW